MRTSSALLSPYIVVAVLIFSFSICLPSVELKNDVCKGFSPPDSCPINCFRADPVCGEDMITYWCGCADAMCHGTRVVKLGACEVGNGGASQVPAQALLLVHIVWLILLGFSLLFGLF